MARVTVEDCLHQLNNRFQLVMLASKRARDLARGSDEPKLPWENDKTTVVALREIAAGEVDIDYLKQAVSTEEVEEPSEAVVNPVDEQQQTS